MGKRVTILHIIIIIIIQTLLLVGKLSLSASQECDATKFECLNKECILAEFRCDGRKHCTDGSDEVVCNNCKTSGFNCRSDATCIPSESQCDGRDDCSDGSDEIKCGGCKSSLFECCNNRCIRASLRCNGEDDCTDGSDEVNCTECKSTAFKCDTKCIPGSYRCDGTADCTDGSDEVGCDECKPSAFNCANKRCIPANFRCDGVKHCTDKSDETECDDFDKCKLMAMANNTEIKRCHTNASCHTDDIGSYRCKCKTGYSGDGFNCSDINECMLMGDTNNNEIQRCHLRATCYNSIGSYRCTCIQGFSGDGFDCSGSCSIVAGTYQNGSISIEVDRGSLQGRFLNDNSRVFTGMISGNCQGTMTFSDGPVRNFEFNPMKNKIFWDKRDTEEMWIKDCSSVAGSYNNEKIHIKFNNNRLTGYFQNASKPNFFGNITASCQGTMTFLDKSTKRFSFNKTLNKVIWNGQGGESAWIKDLKSKPPVSAIGGKKMSGVEVVIISLSCGLMALFFLAVVFVYLRKRHNRPEQNMQSKFARPSIVTLDTWEILPSAAKLNEKIGEGAFGAVYRGNLSRDVYKKTPYHKLNRRNLERKDTRNVVAIKRLKDSPTDTELRDFLDEITLMKSIGFHKNIISFIGCNTMLKPRFLVLEYMLNGDLLHYLRKRRLKDVNSSADVTVEECPRYAGTHRLLMSLDMDDEERLTANDLMSFQWQIACGMEYLSSKDLVHRDLAARNILIGDNKIAKISDFGLTRKVSEELVYMGNKHRKLPVKWMAVESIFHQEFTTYSDVWSFGIVQFEIVTLGGTPYPRMNFEELLSQLRKGYRMEKPENCTQLIYDMMLKCWQQVPKKRPSFTQLREELESIMSDGETYLSLDIDLTSNYYTTPSYKSFSGKHDEMTVSIVDA